MVLLFIPLTQDTQEQIYFIFTSQGNNEYIKLINRFVKKLKIENYINFTGYVNIEILRDKSGKPLIKLKGRTLQFFKKRIKSKNYQIDLSLSDDNPWAHATVIISCYK